ncbi:MAG TPA: hypothetical protein VI685_22175 [Candidatus Angelobacter sp.]
MMNTELMLDLARLLKRYSPDDWESLLRLLRSANFRDQLIYFAGQMQTLSHESRRRERAEFDEATDVAFRHAVLLQRIKSDLRTRKLSEVRDVAYSLGVPLHGKVSRNEMISRIASALSRKDIAELERSAPSSLFSASASDDYRRWGELIMGKTPRKKS